MFKKLFSFLSFGSTAIAAKADQFPWWYQAILGKYMPKWMIQILENPQLTACIIGGIFITQLILIIILLRKYTKLKRTLNDVQVTKDLILKQNSMLIEAFRAKKEPRTGPLGPIEK